MNYIYTVITNGKDKLNENVVAEGAELICFTNDDITTDVWNICKLPDLFTDPRRNSRIPKILPHMFLDMEEGEWSLYVDGNIINTVPIDTLIDIAGTSSFAAFHHPARDCFLDEGYECIRLGLDDPSIILDQLRRYDKIPLHAGLYQGGVLLRKNTLPVRTLCEKWWAHYCRGSKRDQISLAACIHETKHNIALFDGNPWDSSIFTMTNHAVPSEWYGKI